jgi:hypothetical protein
MRIVTTDLGPMGRGSNMFRCGLVHSSGHVFLGTYGPPPGLIWRYDPGRGELVRIGAPGEYQLDCLVEAPDGMIYIGTAYNGLVYRLDPVTGQVTSLGSPGLDSTAWIFTMLRTAQGEIYGAKGVGLFRLDWQAQRLEPLGLVPGDHNTLLPGRSSPITRRLEEGPDGTLWGDTNRWLFRFHPESREIEPLVDMATVDPACYALFLAGGRRPSADAVFCLYARFSGATVRERLYAYRAAEGRVEPIRVPDLPGDLSGHIARWQSQGRSLLLMQTWEEQRQRAHVATVDPATGEVLWEWPRDCRDEPGGDFLVGPGGSFYYFTTTRLIQADLTRRRLVLVAENPTPAECRCLAVSPRGVLGTDTYDLGYAFTLDPATGRSRSHGKVWADDHRANHGPAAFAGRTGRYLLANHGEAMPALWATDTRTDRHRRLGAAAEQLVRFRDGSVWGTQGPNPASIAFDPETCWTPAWQARPGPLFRYVPGAAAVELFPQLGEVGPLAEAPGRPGRLLTVTDRKLLVVRVPGMEVVQRLPLAAGCVALVGDVRRHRAYLVLADGSLVSCRGWGWGVRLAAVCADFGPAERGLIVLPESGSVVGVALAGGVSIWRPGTEFADRLPLPPAPPAGPAVDPVKDAWYYADRTVTKTALLGT